MAAWADRALSADAAAAVELHLSNCERCQEVLAAFVRSEPATGAAVLPFWGRRPVQWSAAGLAAAAALVAMIWIGRPPAGPTPQSTIVSRDVAPTAPPASAPSELRRDRPATVDQVAPPAPASQPSRAAQSSPKPAAPRQERAEAKKAEGRVAAAELPPPVAAPAVTAPPPPPPAAASAPPAVTVTAAA